MDRIITPETRLVDMTAGELLDYLQGELSLDPPGQKRWLSTREEMAESLGVSLRVFYKLRAEGVFDKVIRQCGRLIHAESDALHAAYDRYLILQTVQNLSKNELETTAPADVHPVSGARRARSYQRRENP